MQDTIDQIEFLLEVMKRAQVEHPNEKIYYDWENHRVIVAYPIPEKEQ